MIEWPDYEKATNAAYELLQRYDGGYPQINIFRLVCNYPNIKLHSFSEIASRLRITVSEFITEFSESDMGYTVYDKKNKRWLIFYNDTKCVTTIRFTLAHELGHVVLKHEQDNSSTDREANCFARNLLCPLPIRQEFNLITIDDLCSVFCISESMAQVVIDKTKNDLYYISNSNYGNVNSNIFFYFSGYKLSELFGY